MKNLILTNWKPKLACLLLASALWYLIKNNVDNSPGESIWPAPSQPIQPVQPTIKKALPVEK
ncbi:MAG: hypothetical protein ACK5NG_02825 [Chthoniobacterales bacterium]